MTARLAVEPGASMSWWKWVGTEGDVLGLDRFGASAPGTKVLEELGFTAENIVARARALLEREADRAMGCPPMPPTAHLCPRSGRACGSTSSRANRSARATCKRLIDEDSVVGATSNPTIFQKAMTAGNAYDEQLRKEAGRGSNVKETFWALAERDIKDACDLFRPVWDGGAGRDGYVSLEVDPGLAYDTLATYREAIRLHKAVDRPNLMVKIPATKPGLAAIEDVIAKGHSINVTLIFSLRRYAEVAESYVRGIERLIAAGGDPRKVASVASFFVSRIDTEADRRLDEIGGHDDLEGQARDRQREARLPALQGGVRGPALGVPRGQGRDAAAGAVGEHLDEEPGLPGHAVRGGADRRGHREHDARGDDQGLPGPRPARSPAWSRGSSRPGACWSELAAAGVDYDDVTDTLEREGVEKFSASFDELLAALGAKQTALAA